MKGQNRTGSKLFLSSKYKTKIVRVGIKVRRSYLKGFTGSGLRI
jgi:hypothetical protein